MSASVAHGIQRMTGRDPHETNRAATPLELLFDLTFVVAFGAAGTLLAHALAEGHVGRGLLAFGLSVFAVCWAWINFTWFASAYDTDDWVFRLLTMVQMGGVIILALGLPPAFESITAGRAVDATVMVMGYVVMRVPMVVLWLRAARHDPAHGAACLTYVVTIFVAQVFWCLRLAYDSTVGAWLLSAVVLIVVELAGPVVAEFRFGGTPWHPHHVAERYGLLVIITLGEVLIGTVAAISPFVNDPEQGWTTDAIALLVAGVVLIFGMWWLYFAKPWAEILHHHRERAFFWGYGHMLVFGAIVATGSGLHAVQYFIQHHSHLGQTATLVCVVVPVAVFIGMTYLMYGVAIRSFDRFHLLLASVTAVVLVGAVALSTAGLPLPLCLVPVGLAPAVTVIGHETVGHRHGRDHLERLRATSRAES